MYVESRPVGTPGHGEPPTPRPMVAASCSRMTRTPVPLLHVSARRGGRLEIVRRNPRHIDFMWPRWAVVDRGAEGRGTDWRPPSATAESDRSGQRREPP